MAELIAKMITFKFVMNNVDVLLQLEVQRAFETEKVSTVRLIENLTEQLDLAGAMAVKPSRPATLREKATGANGIDGRQLEPYVDSQGKPIKCQSCGGEIGIKHGVAKKGPNQGKPYRMLVHVNKGSCQVDLGFLKAGE